MVRKTRNSTWVCQWSLDDDYLITWLNMCCHANLHKWNCNSTFARPFLHAGGAILLSGQHTMGVHCRHCQCYQCSPIELSVDAQPNVDTTLGVMHRSDSPLWRYTQSSNGWRWPLEVRLIRLQLCFDILNLNANGFLPFLTWMHVSMVLWLKSIELLSIGWLYSYTQPRVQRFAGHSSCVDCFQGRPVCNCVRHHAELMIGQGWWDRCFCFSVFQWLWLRQKERMESCFSI